MAWGEKTSTKKAKETEEKRKDPSTGNGSTVSIKVEVPLPISLNNPPSKKTTAGCKSWFAMNQATTYNGKYTTLKRAQRELCFFSQETGIFSNIEVHSKKCDIFHTWKVF